jgi:hypothetical protein
MSMKNQGICTERFILRDDPWERITYLLPGGSEQLRNRRQGPMFQNENTLKTLYFILKSSLSC